MDRLIFLIDVLDDSLKEFYFRDIKFYGLAKLELKGENHIPVFYNGFGDNDFVGFEDVSMGIYHRLISEGEEKDNDLGYGRNANVTENYLIKTVVFGNMRKIDDTNIDINYRISDEIGEIIPNSMTETQLDQLGARTGIFNILSKDTNKEAVFALEFPEGEYRLKPENLLFSINHNISLTYA